MQATQKQFRFPVQPGLRSSNDLRVGRKMATFHLFLQSGRGKTYQHSWIFIAAIYLAFHTLWEILFITNIFRVSKEMVIYLEAFRILFLYRYTFQDNFLTGLLCRNEGKKLNLSKRILFAQLIKCPFPLKPSNTGYFTVW